MSTAPKALKFGDDARNATLDGVRKLKTAVAATLGPKGRNALCEQGFSKPMLTKDGVTVAKQINFEDPFEQMGNLIVREAAERSNKRAGDGTTTATILAAAIMEEGKKHLGQGANPILIKKGIDKAVKIVVEELKSHSVQVSGVIDLEAIATISAAGDSEIGKIASDAIWEAGENGIVSIEKSGGLGIEIEKSDGCQFDGGFVSGYMITDPRTGDAIWENTPVLIYEGDLNASREILPLMEKLLVGDEKDGRQSYNRLVVICDNVANDALSAMVVNKIKGNFNTLAVKAPAYGNARKEVMKDLAALTGATYLSKETGRTISSVKPEDLGYARRVTADLKRTMIVGGNGAKEDIDARVDAIKSALLGEVEPLQEKILKERLAGLTGKAIVLRVGAASEMEQKEKHYRVEDALCACRAAKAEGVLPGAGVPYLRASEFLKDKKMENKHEQIGWSIVMAALRDPITCLANNAGMDPKDVISMTLKNTSSFVDSSGTTRLSGDQYAWGYDSMKEEWCDLLANHVIDPMKVAREALENAASVAASWLTLETAMVEIMPTNGDRINVVSPEEMMGGNYQPIQ